MQDSHRSLAFELVSSFGQHLDLSDLRLEKRALTMVSQAVSGGASASLDALFGRDGDKGAKAAQSFLSNDRITVCELRDPLMDLSWQEVQQLGLKEVVVPFDPTYLGFQTQTTKQKRTKLCGHGAGYVWLNSLLVDPQSSRLLGVGRQTLVHREGPDDAQELDYAPGVRRKRERRKESFNPKQQQLAHFRAVSESAPPELVLDFVIDADFDDGLSVREMLKTEENRYFTARSTKNRVVQVEPVDWLKVPKGARKPAKDPTTRLDYAAEESGLIDIYLHDLAGQVPTTFWRELPIDARGRACEEGQKPERLARMEIGAVRVRFGRRSERGKRLRIEEEPEWVNVVVVVERDAPAGATPMQWVLLTSRPIETEEQQRKVARVYEQRWRAEEFFRTTKDALKLEHSRLETPEATAKLLVFVTLKVMFLDALRRAAGIPAGRIPTKEERQELKRGGQRLVELEKMTPKQRSAQPKVSLLEANRMLLGYIAQKGSWKARGATHLGNYILLRGMASFFDSLQLGCFGWFSSIVKEDGS